MKRFRVQSRERKRRGCSEYDRYYVILDRLWKGFEVARICANYPGAELIARAYCLKLNVKAEKGEAPV